MTNPSESTKATAGTTGTGFDTSAAVPARKKRRWLRRILWGVVGLVILLLIVVAALPAIVSTRTGTDLVASTINQQVQGKVSIGRLALSWFGSCRADDLKVADPSGREVASVGGVSFGGGVWGAITSLKLLEQITVDSPQVTLYLASDGSTSLAQAFSPRSPVAARPPAADNKPFELPNAGLDISKAALKVVRPDDRSLAVSDAYARVHVKSSGEMMAELQLHLDRSGTVNAEVDLRGLIASGKIDPLQATGTIRIHSPGGVDLGPLAGFALPESGTTGRLSLETQATLDAGKIAAVFNAQLAGIATKAAGGAEVKPTDLQLAGKISVDADSASGQLSLKGEAGSGTADFAVPLKGNRHVPPADELLAAVLGGQDISLPDFRLNLTAGVDAAALARSVPALLTVRPDTRITAGKLDITACSIKGGNEPAAAVAAKLTDLSAETKEGVIRWDAITTNLDAAAEHGKGAAIRTLEVQAGFARITASGTASKMTANVEGDLSRARAMAAPLVGPDMAELEGRILAKLDVTRVADDRIDVVADLTADKVRIKNAETQVEFDRAQVHHGGYLSRAEGKLTKATAEQVTVDVDGQLVVGATGWYDMTQGGFQGDLQVSRADVAYLAQRAAGAGLDLATLTGGTLAVQAKLQRDSAATALNTEGTLTANGLQVDGQEVTPNAKLTWTGAQLDPQAKRFGLATAKLESDMAGLLAEKFDCRFADKLALTGELSGQADLAKCLATAARVGKQEKPADVSGQLRLRAACSTTGDASSVKGDAVVDDFILRTTDGKTIRDKLHLNYDAALAQSGDKLALQELKLTSETLAARVAGDIEQLKTTRTLKLDGTCDLNWDRITQLLHELAPSTAPILSVAGTYSGKLSAKGPANRPDLKPQFQELQAAADLGWASADAYGVPLGKLALAPKLEDGQLRVPVTGIETAGGRVKIGADVDLRGESPVLRTPKNLAVLENVNVTPELGRSLLSRFNPIFGQATKMEGKVGLTVAELELPLGEQIKTAGAGAGKLELKQFKVQPSEFFALLLELGGLPSSDMYAVQVSGLDFVLKDGRISYQDFTMIFADGQFDAKFRGSVGFDDTLDLIVSVPVREGLLKKLKVTGPVAQYAKKLEGKRVDIPVVGTRGRPLLDLAKVDVTKLLKDVITEGLLGGEGVPGVEDLLGGKKETPPPPKGETPKKGGARKK